MSQKPEGVTIREFSNNTAILNWIKAPLGIDAQAKTNLKKMAFDEITPGGQRTNVAILVQKEALVGDDGSLISYEDFINLDIPYVRLQNNSKINDDYFVSAMAATDLNKLVTESLKYA